MLVGIHGRNDFWGGRFDVSFAPHSVRIVRIEQTGSAERWWWSVHRIAVE